MTERLDSFFVLAALELGWPVARALCYEPLNIRQGATAPRPDGAAAGDDARGRAAARARFGHAGAARPAYSAAELAPATAAFLSDALRADVGLHALAGELHTAAVARHGGLAGRFGEMLVASRERCASSRRGLGWQALERRAQAARG